VRRRGFICVHPTPHTLAWAVSSGVERLVDTEEVTSSNLVSPTKSLRSEPVKPGVFLIEISYEYRSFVRYAHSSGRTGIVPYPYRLTLMGHSAQVCSFACPWIVAGDLSPILGIAGVIYPAVFAFLNRDAQGVPYSGNSGIAES